MAKMGRPTTFTKELGDHICDWISKGGSLRKLCKQDDMPDISSVILWVVKGNRHVEEYKDFSIQYQQAQDDRTEVWAEELNEIADDSDADYIFTDDGKRITNSEAIARSKLRVDTRKWLLSKLRPKKYGDRVTTEVVGDKDNPLKFDGKIEIVHVIPHNDGQHK